MDYLVDQVQVRAEPYGTMAAVELFFSKKNSQAEQALRDLEVENRDRYTQAEQIHGEITSSTGKSRGGTEKGKHTTYLEAV